MSRLCFSLLAAAVLLLQLPALAGDSKPQSSSGAMTPQTRLMIMRDLSSEHVFVRTIFPRGEKGLELKDGKLIPNNQDVSLLVAKNGLAAKPGDRATITNVVVKEKSIVFEINGGSKKHEKWYQHLSVGGQNGTVPVAGGAPATPAATGSTLTLEFDKYVPEITGEQVRAMLAPAFDFKALTQAEAYEKTLPPKVQQAVKEHKVLVGMDRDMVVYAKGRPPKKIRDKDDTGVDYEEWIYGDPPEEVDFVRFQGPVVSRLEIMTVDGEKIVRTQKEVDLQSQETQVASKDAPSKPSNAPTLRRPGEPVEGPGTVNSPNVPYPAKVGTDPGNMPENTPHWQRS